MFKKLINHLSIILLAALILASNANCAQETHFLGVGLSQADQDLLMACRYKNIDLFHTSISNGANINIKDNYGETALIQATGT